MNRSILTLICGCVLLVARTAAQTNPAAWTTPSAEQVNAIYPEVESLYFDLHRSPELAMHEQQTAAKLAERMKALGYEMTTGVAALVLLLCCGTGTAPRYSCAPTWTPYRSKK